ncbi:Hypothetical predicted protein [Cloeon dipterum]|uniref:Uncharacterized protein n=1 Tax=Cloeon dipterum TaxID=197152 RepID=A0A8S1DBC8_9INSE|nr:Hypothetical predicted protein [Cloeon dipterum]
MGTAARSPPVAGQPPAAPSPLPTLRPDLGDDTLFTVYCFIRDFIGASGTSAVAIDNKIEQAMDLVKSHLMFAVREEVEVLKEKIVELTGRINQLEFENTVLKAHASADTLQLISKPPPTQNSKLHTHTYTRTHPYERLTHTHTLGRACLVCENELRSSLPRPTPRRVLSAPEIYS